MSPGNVWWHARLVCKIWKSRLSLQHQIKIVIQVSGQFNTYFNLLTDLATSPIPQDSWLLMETHCRKKRTNSCSSSSSSSSHKSISRRKLELIPVLTKKPIHNTIAIQTGSFGFIIWIQRSNYVYGFSPFVLKYNKRKISNHGGLDSRDQSRSRSRTSYVSRLTFLNCRDFLDGRDQLFFSRSRFLKSRFFSRDFDASRFLSRLSRHVEIVKICRDTSRFSRFVETQSRFVETQSRFVEKSRHCRGLKSRRIEKSRRENAKIHALLGRDRDKLSRNAENFRSRRISRSRSRLFGLDIVVETKSRSLNLDRDISIVETNFWKASILSIMSRSTFENRRDRESRSRPRWDKSRPPRLKIL
jgi:hypothetical protein